MSFEFTKNSTEVTGNWQSPLDQRNHFKGKRERLKKQKGKRESVPERNFPEIWTSHPFTDLPPARPHARTHERKRKRSPGWGVLAPSLPHPQIYLYIYIYIYIYIPICPYMLIYVHPLYATPGATRSLGYGWDYSTHPSLWEGPAGYDPRIRAPAHPMESNPGRGL